MPAKGVKRGRAAGDHGAKRCKMVADAVFAANVLPTTAAKMLGNTVSGSLGISPDERDKYQNAFVDMLDSLLKNQEAEMKKELHEAESKVETSTAALAACEAKVKQLEVDLVAKEEDIESKKKELSEKKDQADARSSELQAALASQASHTSEIDKIKNEQETFEKVKTEHFKILRDEPPPRKVEAKQHIKVLEKTIAPLNLEEAVHLGIPSTLTKMPDKRGAFDKMLVDFLATTIDEHVEQCRSSVAAGAQEAAARAAAVDAAQSAADDAKSQQSRSSDAVDAAFSDKKLIQAHIKEAQTNVKDQTKEAKQIDHNRMEAQKIVTDFAEVLAAFALERDGEAKPQAEAL